MILLFSMPDAEIEILAKIATAEKIDPSSGIIEKTQRKINVMLGSAERKFIS